MKVAVRDIKANPFRNVERYPINREKVEILRESLRATGFWNNVVARKINGSVELAYGHHRLVAVKEEFGPDYKINLIVRDLNDTMMLQIMARENMEQWKQNCLVEQETLRATIEAFAQNKIQLGGVVQQAMAKGAVRIAPSFIIVDAGPPATETYANPKAYSPQTVAEFLGWTYPNGTPTDRITYGLIALQLIEMKIATERDFENSTTQHEKVFVNLLLKTLSLHKGQPDQKKIAKKVARAIGEKFREGAAAPS